MKNRRNYYRVLHVQPDAPLEIIKASYRGLMTTLKAHPDLGGEHEAAVLINQAYGVLSNPEKRRRYDLDRQGIFAGAPTLHGAQRRTGATAATRAYQRHTGSGATPQATCLFCASAVVPAAAASTRCAFCACPLLWSVAHTGRRQMEVFGRRAAPRIAKSGNLMLYSSWPSVGHRSQLRDLSLLGISLFCDFAPHQQQILKIDSPLLAGVLQVASVRASGGRYRIHGPLLVAEFATQSGGFVSTRV
jgi:curved DNA-binding protein CbpA